MGFLSFLFGKPKVSELQKIVFENNLEQEMVLPEKIVKNLAEDDAKRQLEIMNDCARILQTTNKPDTFFSRLELFKKTLDKLCRYEPYLKFEGAKPSQAMKEYYKDKDKIIMDFIERYFKSVFEKANTLKTEKGKDNQYKKFKENMVNYSDFLNDEHRNYIETALNSV